MNTKLHIGFDVHKNSMVVATAHADGGDPQHYGKWGGSVLAAERGLLKIRKKFGVEKDEVRFCIRGRPHRVRPRPQAPQTRLRLHPRSTDRHPDKSGRPCEDRPQMPVSSPASCGLVELVGINIPRCQGNRRCATCAAPVLTPPKPSRAANNSSRCSCSGAGSTTPGQTNWTQAHY